MILTASRIGAILLILTVIISQAVSVAVARSGAAVTSVPSGDTLVQTDHGERPISEIKVGDKVLAYDEATGKTGYFAVTALISNLDFTVQDLTIDGEQIETTAGHPFYTQERGWVKAADLKVGEHVRKADGSYGVVKVDHAQMQVQRMYNLTVDKAHTFFVGGQQWLVHNTDPLCIYFGQKRLDPTFSVSKKEVPEILRGKSIYEVAEQLGKTIDPNLLRVEYFEEVNGLLVSTNTRGLATWSLAGTEPTSIVEIANPSKNILRRLSESLMVPSEYGVPNNKITLPGTFSAVTPSMDNLEILDVIKVWWAK